MRVSDQVGVLQTCSFIACAFRHGFWRESNMITSCVLNIVNVAVSGTVVRPLTLHNKRAAGHVRTVIPQASLIDRFGRVTKGYTFFYGDKVGKPCVLFERAVP